MKALVNIFIILLVNINLFGAYTVDLGAPPEARWTELVNQYDKESLRRYAVHLDEAIVDANSILEFDWVRKLIMKYGQKKVDE